MIRSTSRFPHRAYTTACVALYKRTEVIDEVGVPNETYSLVAVAPCSVNETSTFRSMQYMQVGVVDVVNVKFRKTCESFDRAVLVDCCSAAPKSATNDEINSMREVIVTARTGFDLARMGDEVTIEGKRNEGESKR